MQKIVMCRYSGTNNIHYAFKTDLELKAGEIVVVDSSNGLGITTVMSTTPSVKQASRATRWVVQRVDMDAFEARIMKEREKEVILAEMENLKSKIEKESIYELLADKNPEMKALLQKLREIE